MRAWLHYQHTCCRAADMPDHILRVMLGRLSSELASGWRQPLDKQLKVSLLSLSLSACPSLSYRNCSVSCNIDILIANVVGSRGSEEGSRGNE